jgi:hypothetical protein
MIIKSQSLFATKLIIGGRSVNQAGLRTVASFATAATPTSKTASSIYDNFSREMSRRLATAPNQADQDVKGASDSSALVQSLTGAMGEIEQVFGREAATEAMAKVLVGTEGEVSETPSCPLSSQL